MMKRIFGLKEKPTAPEEQDCNADQQSTVAPSVREQLLNDAEFSAYIVELTKHQGSTAESIPDSQLYHLFDVWSDQKEKGTDNTALITIGVGALAALSVFSPPAHAGLGDEIGNQIMKLVGPYIEKAMAFVTSTLGVDIDTGATKQAIAAGKSVDAQNEVLKAIYNKDAARAAEPAPGGCVSDAISTKTVAAQAQSRITMNDMIVTRNDGRIYISSTIRNATQRIQKHNDNVRNLSLQAQGVSPSASAAEQVKAVLKTASVSTIDSKLQYTEQDKKAAEAHVSVLFQHTDAINDIEVEAHTPEQRYQSARQTEAYATLEHCKHVFDKDISERTSAGADSPSFRAMLEDKINAEYGSEDFQQEVNAITHAVPALKTLINQQAFTNMLAVKTFDQNTELLRLMALQLKENVRSNLS